MLLSVCIPTYNRGERVISLLQFLSSEIDGNDFFDDIEILISDNCSTDNTQHIISEYIKDSDLFVYHRNEENLGLIGNLHKLVELSKGKYVWFMGDDDIYHKGILKRVYNELSKEDISYLFINHCAYVNHIGDGTGFESAIPDNVLRKKHLTLDSLLSIFNYSGTSLMFISTSVYNRNTLSHCVYPELDNLALPLFWSFYCASKGSIQIIPELMVENKWGAVSWSSEKKAIFEEYIPRIFKQLPMLGYNRLLSKFSLSWFMYKRSTFHGYLKAFKHRICKGFLK